MLNFMPWLALLSTLILANPSDLSARDDEPILIHCNDKNFHGYCDYGKYDRCTPLIMVTRSLSVQEGYQCVLYDGPECRVDNVSPRYVGDRFVRKSVFDVDFRIMSVICRPAPSLMSVRAFTTNKADHVESSAAIESHSAIDSPTVNVNDNWSLIICSSQDRQGSCDRGFYETCTGTGAINHVESLSVREGIQCEFYPKSGCRNNNSGGPFHVGDKNNRATINNVHFPVESFKCHRFAVRREENGAAISEREQTKELCREGEHKCTRSRFRSGVIACVKGAWRTVQTCTIHQICVKEPEAHCSGR